MTDKLIICASAKEAVEAKSPGNIYVAGGTDVMRLGSDTRLDSFVSLRKAKDMRGIDLAGASLTIGAASTFQELLDNDIVPAYLKEALLFMASRTRRNMSTIGGNIALRRDDSFLIPTLIAADAELVLMSKDGSVSRVNIKDYVFDEAKYEALLIKEIILPTEGISLKSVRNSNTAQSHARLTASLALKDGRYTAAAAVKNSGIYAFEGLASLMNEKDSLSEEEIIEFVKSDKDIKLKDDLLYGSADYRRYLIGISFALMYEELNAKGGRA